MQCYPVVLRSDIRANTYLYAYACSFLYDTKQVSRGCSIQIGFAAHPTDLGRNVLKDHCGAIPFKGHSGGSRLSFSLLANDAFHGFFLLKSAAH
jgi:hypothetical protein